MKIYFWKKFLYFLVLFLVRPLALAEDLQCIGNENLAGLKTSNLFDIRDIADNLCVDKGEEKKPIPKVSISTSRWKSIGALNKKNELFDNAKAAASEKKCKDGCEQSDKNKFDVHVYPLNVKKPDKCLLTGKTVLIKDDQNNEVVPSSEIFKKKNCVEVNEENEKWIEHFIREKNPAGEKANELAGDDCSFNINYIAVSTPRKDGGCEGHVEVHGTYVSITDDKEFSASIIVDHQWTCSGKSK